MGNSDSKKNKKKESDGLIGSRKIRTFLVGGILIAFSILALPYIFDLIDVYKALSTGPVCDGLELLGQKCDQTLYIAYSMIAAGLFMILIFSIMAILLHCVNCDGGVETVVGFGELAGAIVYLIGWIMVLAKINDLGFTGAQFFILVGEAILAGGIALFLALDIIRDFMEDESRRLFWNLLLLAIVAGCCLTGYADRADAASSVGFTDNSSALIATGYAVILVCSIVYMVLNLCSCLTCNCQDNCFIRLLLSGGLIIGGLLCSIGYYVSIGDYGNGGNYWTYFVGYTILIGGDCIIWALDMGIVDDVKGGTSKK